LTVANRAWATADKPFLPPRTDQVRSLWGFETSAESSSTPSTGAFPACLEKGNVLGVARCRSPGFGDSLETQEVLLRGDVEHMRANPGARRVLGELRCGDGKVEQEVDAKACLRVEEVRARRGIEAKPDGRDLAIGDRRDHVSHLVQT